MSKNITIKIDFNAPVTLASARDVLRQFVSWWGDEVLELLPQTWKQELQSSSARPSLTITDDEWSLLTPDGTVITLNLHLPAYELRDEIARKAPDSLRRSIDVILSRQGTLFKRLLLPSAAEPRLKQVVRLQLDRLSPFRGDDVQFDCWVIPEGADAMRTPSSRDSSIPVEVAILPKRRLADIEGSVRAVGLTPHTFRVADSQANFPPLGLPWTKHTQKRAMLTALGVSLITLAVALSPGLRSWEISDLREQTEAVRPQVERAQAEKGELSRYQLPAQAISAGRAPAIDLLLDFTKRLPDSVSVSRLQIFGQKVTIEGHTATPIDVRAMISRSPILVDVRSTSLTSTSERFSLTATLKPGISGER
jgi:general secretion pathway protein L